MLKAVLLLLVFLQCAYSLNFAGTPKIIKLKQSGLETIPHRSAQVGTTEFFVVANSHGNPQHGRWTKQAEVSGGGWKSCGSAGDNDKSLEVWERVVDNSNKNSAGTIKLQGNGMGAIVAFKARLGCGNVVGRGYPNGKEGNWKITNRGSGPFLVLACSDNSGSSTMADYVFDKKGNTFNKVGDDPLFVYLLNNGEFHDPSSGRRRGALMSIQLTGNASPRPSPGPSGSSSGSPPAGAGSCGLSTTTNTYSNDVRYHCKTSCRTKCQTNSKGNRSCGRCGTSPGGSGNGNSNGNSNGGSNKCALKKGSFSLPCTSPCNRRCRYQGGGSSTRKCGSCGTSEANSAVLATEASTQEYTQSTNSRATTLSIVALVISSVVIVALLVVLGFLLTKTNAGSEKF